MRNILIFILVGFCGFQLSAQSQKYQLITHILDITTGMPSVNVSVMLEKQNPENSGWQKIDERKTDENGRIGSFLTLDENLGNKNDGIYRLTFFTRSYFESRGIKTFYPFVQVVFEIEGNSHYHVPITLSPYGYSTYRGS